MQTERETGTKGQCRIWIEGQCRIQTKGAAGTKRAGWNTVKGGQQVPKGQGGIQSKGRGSRYQMGRVEYSQRGAACIKIVKLVR